MGFFRHLLLISYILTYVSQHQGVICQIIVQSSLSSLARYFLSFNAWSVFQILSSTTDTVKSKRGHPQSLVVFALNKFFILERQFNLWEQTLCNV